MPIVSLARGACLVALVAAIPLPPRVAAAQDTTHAVRIGLTYQPGTKPGVVVTAVRGPWGDSVQAIIARDLDYGDRINVIGLPGSEAAGALQNAGHRRELSAVEIARRRGGGAGHGDALPAYMSQYMM